MSIRARSAVAAGPCSPSTMSEVEAGPGDELRHRRVEQRDPRPEREPPLGDPRVEVGDERRLVGHARESSGRECGRCRRRCPRGDALPSACQFGARSRLDRWVRAIDRRLTARIRDASRARITCGERGSRRPPSHLTERGCTCATRTTPRNGRPRGTRPRTMRGPIALRRSARGQRPDRRASDLEHPLLRAVVPALPVLREDPRRRLQRLRHLQPHVPAGLLRRPGRGVLAPPQRRDRVGRLGRADRRDQRAGRVAPSSTRSPAAT